MALTHAQKKYLKKHAKEKTPAALAADLSVNEGSVISYLERLWGKNKFRSRTAPDTGTRPLRSDGHVFGFRNHLRLYLGSAALVCLAYANSLNNAFVSDDIRYLVNNPHLASFSFVTDTPVTVLKALINWLTFRSFGLSPWAFHGVNIVFHILAVWCIFAILRLFTDRRAAVVAAAIVAVHPIFTEAVTWIGGGGYVMYGALFLLSFLLYVTAGGNRFRYAASVAVFGLALLSSEKAVPLAVLFPAYEWTGLAGSRRFKRALPHVLLTAVWITLILTVFRFAQSRIAALETEFSVSGYYNPLTQIPVAISSYLGLVFFPGDLSFFHSQLTFPKPEFVLRVTATLLFLAATGFAFLKDRLIFLFLLLVPVSLSPSLTPFIVGWVVAERYAYLAAVGIIVAVVLTVFRLTRTSRARQAVAALAVLIVCLLTVRTVIRNIDWTNEDTLWFATYRTAPTDPRVHTNVGEYYLRRSDYTRAETEFKKALELSQTRPYPYYDLASVYYSTDRKDDAIPLLTKAISLRKDFTDAYQLLSSVYYETGNYRQALDTLDQLKQLDPDNVFIYINAGRIYEKLNDPSQALASYRHALMIDKNNQTAAAAISRLEK